MTMEGRDLTPLESNLHKFDLYIISQIIQMSETDVSWHQKTFESVLTNPWKMWKEGIHKLENASMYCTENGEIDNEMDGVQVIDLCTLQTRSSINKSMFTLIKIYLGRSHPKKFRFPFFI